jgi:hypothetical protein
MAASAIKHACDASDCRFFAEDADPFNERADGSRLGDVQLEGRTPRFTVSHRPLAKGGYYTEPQEQMLHLPGELLAHR